VAREDFSEALLGAAEIGAVLAALPEAKHTSRFSPGLWLAGATSISLLSFIAGFLMMQASLVTQDQLGVPLSLVALATGDADIGRIAVNGSSRRTVIIVLAVCLALSLSAAGALFAARWFDRPLAAAFAAAMQAYPPHLRREIRHKLFEDRDALRTAVEDLRDARDRMFVLMRADPIDHKALDGAMEEVRAKTTALQALLQSVLAASLETVPPSERQKIEAPRLGLGLFRGNNP
jgi:uncharacterized membrane protein